METNDVQGASREDRIGLQLRRLQIDQGRCALCARVQAEELMATVDVPEGGIGRSHEPQPPTQS